MTSAPLISVAGNPAPKGGEAIFMYRRDICLRAARWPGAPGVPEKGTIALLHGRTEFIEKYFEVIDDLRARGFAVLTFDWRGQGLSSRELADRWRGHVDDFQHYLDDMEFILQSDFAKDLPPLKYMLSHSMGGNIGLRYLYRHPDLVERAVFCAPMLGIGRRGTHPVLGALASGAIMLGRAKEEPFVSVPQDPATALFETNPVTSDEARFRAAQASVAAEPLLGVAGLSWQWTAEAIRSINENWRPELITAMKTPSLFVGAGLEKLVDPTGVTRFAALSPLSEAIVIEGGKHELMMERDVFRTQFFEAMDEFLARQAT